MPTPEIHHQSVPEFDQRLQDIENVFSQYEGKIIQEFPISATHYHVGGTVADRFGIDTIAHIDPLNRIVTMEQEKAPSLLRADLSVKDVDTFVIYKDEAVFRQMRQEFGAWKKPLVSVEATPFPGWNVRAPWMQMVSSMHVDDENRLYLTMQYMKQEIPWKSVEPWTLKLASGVELPILNPFVNLYRYVGRSPSGAKRKDTLALGVWLDAAQKAHRYSKLSLMGRLAVQVLHAGRAVGIDYLSDEYFGSWAPFLYRVHNTPDILTHVYADATRWFWNGPGTDISHGKGPLGFLVTLQDKMGSR